MADVTAKREQARQWFYDHLGRSSPASAAIWTTAIRSGEVDDRLDELIAAQDVFDSVLGPAS